MNAIFYLVLIFMLSLTILGQDNQTKVKDSSSPEEKLLMNKEVPFFDCPGEILKPNEIERNVNLFFVALAADPTARGIIFNYGTDREVKSRISRIKQHIKLHRFDINRIEFIKGGNKAGIVTRFFVLAEGEEIPKP